MYKAIIRPLLFLFDPEKVHHFSFRFLRFVFAFPGGKKLLRSLYGYKSDRLSRELFGLKFKNPLGLAAGFDKDGIIGGNWENLGFGFVELGTVTPRPQVGNPKKRLFRLPKDKAIINRMGFNNRGVEHLVEQLKKTKRSDLIIGGNIGKNKDTPNDQAFEDYRICFEALFPWVDYFVVNVSSPNTPNLRDLQEKEPLTRLLKGLQGLNQQKDQPKPILLKIAPDLSEGQVDDILEIVRDSQIAGLVATNTTISREGLKTSEEEVKAIGAGGLSGKPLTQRSTEMIAYIHRQSRGSVPIIAVGGIMTPADAQAKLDAGASLVQVYTGFVYEGPGFAKKVCKGIS